jgi:pimeloyl-ACP methyl ester carboxylesterase
MFGYIDNDKDKVRRMVKNILSPALGRPAEHLDFETIPVSKTKDLFAIIRPEIMKQQTDISQVWTSTKWSGICNELTKISSPTLILTGTDDNNVPPALIIAGKIPGVWVVQIKDAGHGLLVQYPNKVNKILQTFLTTTIPQIDKG